MDGPRREGILERKIIRKKSRPVSLIDIGPRSLVMVAGHRRGSAHSEVEGEVFFLHPWWG